MGGSSLPWVAEIKYLGVTLLAARTFTCDFHPAKNKFFRSLNGILGKIGNMSAIPLILKIVSTNCNPSLLYGLEACPVTKRQLKSLSYPFNSVFMKLFKTFNADIIRQVQYFSGYMPLSYTIDLRRLSFFMICFISINPPQLPSFSVWTLMRW